MQPGVSQGLSTEYSGSSRDCGNVLTSYILFLLLLM